MSSTVAHEAGATSRTSSLWPWVSLILRLFLAAVFLTAGLPKLSNISASQRAVRVYEIFGYETSNLIGILLPIGEVILGVMLLIGLFTRTCAIVATVLLVVFMAGIASAWARGLNIDCGCFSTGGPTAANATKYPQELLRDALFLIAAGVLAWKPLSRFSADRALWGA